MTALNKPSFKEMYASFLKRVQRWDDVFDTALNEISETEEVVQKLNPAKSCLSIGTSTGKPDVMFIHKFLPNLKILTAVEPDTPAAEELVYYLQNQLPNVDSTVLQKTGEEFLKGDDTIHAAMPYDAVLLFNVLYHFSREDRLSLFQKLHGNLLSRSGSIIIQHEKRTTRADDYQRLVDELSTTEESRLLAETIIDELLATGFEIYRRQECRFDLDFSGQPDEGLLRFIAGDPSRPPSSVEFCEAVRRIQPTGRFTTHDLFLFVHKR